MINQKGFTLIELMVVIAIIGILAAIAIPKFSSANDTARGSKIVADLRTIDSAISIVIANGKTVPTGEVVSTNEVGKLLNAVPVPPIGKYVGPQGTTAVLDNTTKYQVNETATGSGVFRATLGATVTAVAESI